MSFLGSLKKKIQGAEAQINPFDRGATYNTVVNNTPVPAPNQVRYASGPVAAPRPVASPHPSFLSDVGRFITHNPVSGFVGRDIVSPVIRTDRRMLQPVIATVNDVQHPSQVYQPLINRLQTSPGANLIREGTAAITHNPTALNNAKLNLADSLNQVSKEAVKQLIYGGIGEGGFKAPEENLPPKINASKPNVPEVPKPINLPKEQYQIGDKVSTPDGIASVTGKLPNGEPQLQLDKVTQPTQGAKINAKVEPAPPKEVVPAKNNPSQPEANAPQLKARPQNPASEVPSVDNTTSPPISQDVTPTDAAIMDTAAAYNSPQHYVDDAAKAAYAYDKSVKGGQLVDRTNPTEAYGSGRIRITEHSPFYSKYFKENGAAPSLQAYKDQITRELNGHSGQLTHSDEQAIYQLLKDRENAQKALLDSPQATRTKDMQMIRVDKKPSVPKTVPVYKGDNIENIDQVMSNSLGISPAKAAALRKSAISAEDRQNARILKISPVKARNMRLNGEKLPENNKTVNEPLSKMPSPAQEMPKTAKTSGDLPPMQEVNGPTKLFASKVNVLRKIGTKSSNDLADRITNIEAETRDMRAKWMNMLPTVQKLSKSDFEKAWDIQEGKLKPSKVSPTIQQAAKELKTVMAEVHNAAKDQGVIIGEQNNYMPHHYDMREIQKNKSMYDSAIQHLMDTQQIDHQTAVQLFKDTEREMTRWPVQFGNFENARLTDMPGYVKNKSVLYNYLEKGARRIASTRNFGIDNQIASKLLDNVRMEGGDVETAIKAVSNYMRSADRGLGSNVLRTARGTFGAFRLGKAAISHAGQTSNTAVDTGVGNTVKNWVRYILHNPKDQEFIAKTGVTNPQELHGYQVQYTGAGKHLSRITAPGLNQMMHINRSVTALAYRDFARYLAGKGKVAELRKLGVKGNIGKTLTADQEIQAARGGVTRTMFGANRAHTPIYAETPLGKTVGQYRTAYTYRQTGFIFDRIVKEAGKGNLTPLVRYLGFALPIAYGTITIKNKISNSKEGPGGKALDVIGAAGGLPGEIAMQGARYGKKDLVKFGADTVAPLAGEATQLVEDIQNAIKNKYGKHDISGLEAYGAGLVPIIGSRLQKKVYGTSNKAESAQKAVTTGNVDINELKAKPPKGYSLQKTSDGKFAYTLSDGKVHQSDDLNKAQDAIRLDQFKATGKKEGIIGKTYFHTTKSGKITSAPLISHEHSQNSVAMTEAQKAGDLPKWMNSAQSQLKNITKQLKDPKLSSSDAIKLANQAQTLQSDIRKYHYYGGFDKPANVKAYKDMGKITGGRPDYVAEITKAAAKYGLDINAVLSVAAVEGLGGGVGDGGTSFGPFQLHVGGALPQGKDQKWAESPEGIDYAVKTIASVARGKSGPDAVSAIVNGFERPADPQGEVAKALSIYTGDKVTLTPGAPGSASIASGMKLKAKNFTPTQPNITALSHLLASTVSSPTKHYSHSVPTVVKPITGRPTVRATGYGDQAKINAELRKLLTR